MDAAAGRLGQAGEQFAVFRTLDKIRRALESTRVEFIVENGGGRGVRTIAGEDLYASNDE